MYVHEPAFIKTHDVIKCIPVKKLNHLQLSEIARVALTELVNRAMENGNTQSIERLHSIFQALNAIDDEGFIDRPRNYINYINSFSD